MKLALGTVQFGLHYGVANIHGRVADQEVRNVINLAKCAGIDTLDTAIAYGDSEAILGQLGVADWNVITKLPAMPDKALDVYSWVYEQVHASLSRLNAKRLYGLMLHRPMQLLEQQGPALFEALERVKAEGWVEKTGISVYGAAELTPLCERYEFDLVQAPLNIWDRRLVDSGWSDRLKGAGVELHVRSAFLQGLLLMQSQDRPKKFSRWSQVWNSWDAWLLASGCSPLEACLRYLNDLASVDRVVVGVDTSAQLEQILLASQGELGELPQFNWMGDERILNPACWSEL